MKRIINIFSVLSAALCVIACSEKISAELPDAQDYITVTSQTESQVKAGYEGVSVLPGSFHMDINTPYFSGTMTQEGTTNKYNFPDGVALKWGDTNLGNVSINAITVPSSYNRTSGLMKISTDQRTTSGIEASDLLGASIGKGVVINRNNINISFNHLMSKFRVQYNATGEVSVTSIKISQICVEGTCTYPSMTCDASASPKLGEIQMYHNSSDHSAEAIFFPYTPTAAQGLKLTVTATVNKQTETFNCDVPLTKVNDFVSGKNYIMNIVISGSAIEGAEVTVKEWNTDVNSIQMAGQRVLWIGTSIPSGAPPAIVSYPDILPSLMNCEVVNKAVAGSLVIKSVDKIRVTQSESGVSEDDYKNYLAALKKAWDNYEQTNQDVYGQDANAGEYSTYHLIFGGLAQTHADIDAYKSDLTAIGGSDWADKHIAKLKSLSYMSRILPYINGEKDNCNVVILDHGFNDRGKMVYEANGYKVAGEHVEGYTYMMDLINGTYDYDAYVRKLNQWPNLTLNRNYIVDMTEVINAIKNENPDVKIIIGNYFMLDCPFVAKEYRWTATHPDLLSTTYTHYGSLICYFNEAVAALNHLDVVNVYKYLRVDEEKYWNFDYSRWDADYTSASQDAKASISPLPYVIYDNSKFAPDGVHPFHPDALKSIAAIYARELDGVIGSRK